MKRTHFVALSATLFSLFTLPVWATEYTIDASHSEIGFKVRHLTISWVKGRFGTFSGSFQLPDEGLEGASTEAVIQTASIDTGVENRDNHLRSADFFDVANHPEMTFRSKSITGINGNQFQIVGDLTIRGTTREVTLDAELLGKVTDPQGNPRAAFSAHTVINRQDFGLKWSRTLEAGGLVVGDEVQIDLEIEGIAKP